jgi:hypothetical protein
MNLMRNIMLGVCMLALMGRYATAADSKLEVIYKNLTTSPRMTYAAEQVRSACSEVSAGGILQISVQGPGGADKLKPEGFRVKSLDEGAVAVVGADQSGVFYGCLDLAQRIRAAKAMPAKLDLTDAPEFKLRGTCIGMQKLTGGYLWPYTPENFPFFYDQEQWCAHLDIHAFKYEQGKQTLKMIGEGSYVMLGVVPANALSMEK